MPSSAATRSSTAPVAYVIGNTDLLRCLAPVARCVAVAAPGAPARYSRFASEVVDWPFRPSESDEIDVVERLVEHASRLDERPALFYETDAALDVVSRHRDRLADAFLFVIDTPDHVRDWVDKARFLTVAEQLGLRVPRTRHVRPASEAFADLSGVAYPAIIKPLTRDHHWDEVGRTSKVLLVSSPDELRALWGRLEGIASGILVQEVVEGPETMIESYHVYVDAHGETAAEFTGRKIRTRPREHGHSTALEITDSEEVRDHGREATRALGLRGVAKFDYKRDPDGRLWLLEVNPRFTLWHHPAMAAGLNVPAMVLADLLGHERPQGATRPGVRWVHPFDVLAAREWDVSPAAWLRHWVRAETRSIAGLDDPGPLIGHLAWRAGRRLRGLARGARR